MANVSHNLSDRGQSKKIYRYTFNISTTYTLAENLKKSI